jgi:hypothetical protein
MCAGWGVKAHTKAWVHGTGNWGALLQGPALPREIRQGSDSSRNDVQGSCKPLSCCEKPSDRLALVTMPDGDGFRKPLRGPMGALGGRECRGGGHMLYEHWCVPPTMRRLAERPPVPRAAASHRFDRTLLPSAFLRIGFGTIPQKNCSTSRTPWGGLPPAGIEPPESGAASASAIPQGARTCPNGGAHEKRGLGAERSPPRPSSTVRLAGSPQGVFVGSDFMRTSRAGRGSPSPISRSAWGDPRPRKEPVLDKGGSEGPLPAPPGYGRAFHDFLGALMRLLPPREDVPPSGFPSVHCVAGGFPQRGWSPAAHMAHASRDAKHQIHAAFCIRLRPVSRQLAG